MRENVPPAERRAYVGFRDAIVDFSDDPSPDNLARYLAASGGSKSRGAHTGRATAGSAGGGRALGQERIPVEPAFADEDDIP